MPRVAQSPSLKHEGKALVAEEMNRTPMEFRFRRKTRPSRARTPLRPVHGGPPPENGHHRRVDIAPVAEREVLGPVVAGKHDQKVGCGAIDPVQQAPTTFGISEIWTRRMRAGDSKAGVVGQRPPRPIERGFAVAAKKKDSRAAGDRRLQQDFRKPILRRVERLRLLAMSLGSDYELKGHPPRNDEVEFLEEFSKLGILAGAPEVLSAARSNARQLFISKDVDQCAPEHRWVW